MTKKHFIALADHLRCERILSGQVVVSDKLLGRMGAVPRGNVMMEFNTQFEERFMSGNITEREIIEAIADGIKSRAVWQSRGYYRRLAQTLIDGGWVSERGDIL